jgi:site-specific DNA-methyltransferase (adenine-specific)
MTDDGPSAVLADSYACIDESYCRGFIESWAPRVDKWMVIFGDHVSCRWWLDALAAADFQTFAPVVWAKGGAAPRFTGDGPASQCEHIAVGRRRRRPELVGGWSLPGWYTAQTVRHGHGHGHLGLVGAKPVDLMRAIVRDYSRPGWTIADPHAGSGTTAIACRAEGRSCITTELDPKTYEIARRRIDAPASRPLFANVGAA